MSIKYKYAIYSIKQWINYWHELSTRQTVHTNTKYRWKVTRAFKVRKRLLIKIVKKMNYASRCKICNYCGYLCGYTRRKVQKSIESFKYSTRMAFKKIKRIFVWTSVSFIAFAKRTNLHKAPQPSNNRNCRKVTKCHERGKITRGGRRVYNTAYVYIYIRSDAVTTRFRTSISGVRIRRSSRPTSLRS